MPDLAEVSQLSPQNAFDLFESYLEEALNGEFFEKLFVPMINIEREKAILGMNSKGHDRFHTNTPEEHYQILNGMPVVLPHNRSNDYRLMFIETTLQLRVKDEMRRYLYSRITPLLPAIQSYVENHMSNPMTSARLTSFIVKLKPQHASYQYPFFSGPQESKFDSARTYLQSEFYRGLVAIADTYIASDKPSASDSIQWKGLPAELYVLFEELVGKGWIEIPTTRGKRSRDKLARRVHSVFVFASGTKLGVGTAVNYLKKGSNGINEQRPEPRVPFELKWNPDVGKGYDPDKSGQ